MKKLFTVVLSAAFLSIASGCSQETMESAGKDVRNDVIVAGREAQRAERKARPQVAKLALGARVTAALKASSKLPGSIRVDADENSVYLRGTVDTKEQKALAGRIAADTLSESQKVHNELKVAEGQ